MILNFRLLAGLMSFEFILWSVHLSERAPAGIFESKLIGRESYLQQVPKPKILMAMGMERKPT